MCRVYFEQCRPYSPRIGECSLLIDDNNLGSEYEHIAEISYLRRKPEAQALVSGRHSDLAASKGSGPPSQAPDGGSGGPFQNRLCTRGSRNCAPGWVLGVNIRIRVGELYIPWAFIHSYWKFSRPGKRREGAESLSGSAPSNRAADKAVTSVL